MTLTIKGKEYQLRLRMLAARNFEKTTGKSLFQNSAIEDIFGNSKDKAFNSDLFCEFCLACIQDGSYPEKVDLNTEDIAASLSINDTALASNMVRFISKEKYGLTDEQYDKLLKDALEKNQTATREVAS